MGNRSSSSSAPLYYVVNEMDFAMESRFNRLNRNIQTGHISQQILANYECPIITYWDSSPQSNPKLWELTALRPALQSIGIYTLISDLARTSVPCILGYIDNNAIEHITIVTANIKLQPK